VNVQSPSGPTGYGLDILPLAGRVTAYHGGIAIASSITAKVMYETRLNPTVYFPMQDVQATISGKSSLKTFCPFKGTAKYLNISIDGTDIENAAWVYENALPESRAVEGYVGFMPGTVTDLDLGDNVFKRADSDNISGPMVDWLLREAAYLTTPEDFTTTLAAKMLENGIAVSRLSLLIWSLHPLIAGKVYNWNKSENEVRTFAPPYEIRDDPQFINSPLRHVSDGLGGIRQKLGTQQPENSFPIMEDLRAQGATDYVAMPLRFSDGRTNVLTLTCDHPDGFTTANLGLVFECSSVISRYYEVFMQRENAQSLLETYVGKRSGSRVLGGEIRRGDGDEIDAAIMFCDLRGSTRLEETLGRGDYIKLLNEFFETTSTIVDEHGGEVLKFIGDAVLAVFPAEGDAAQARAQALASAQDIVARLKLLREEGSAHDCDCSIGIAYGNVIYGNVGSRERLDFTVIGRAANIAARLGDYGKSLGHRIVVTDDVMNSTTPANDLGQVELHNVSKPVRCFAISAETSVTAA
jgi:adenylate cyclase